MFDCELNLPNTQQLPHSIGVKKTKITLPDDVA